MPVLQARAFRSVSLEPEWGAQVVVKRFHHPNALLARFDGARARREFAALAELFARGVSVPRPLGLERTSAGWELRVQAVPAARTLADCLRGAPPPGGWAALLRRLGALLAGLQCSGWEHRDLHPGNVLVDGEGKPWLIDLQRARRAAPDRARVLAELVACAAHVREALPAHLRLRCLWAWLEALPPALRPELGRNLGRAVEDRSRLWRLESVRTHLDRWLRESSRVTRAEATGSALVRRDLVALSPPERLARAPHVLRGTTAEVRARWLGAARLHEHGLPVLRPALYSPGSRWSGRGAWAAFEDAAPRAPGAIRALLADRGLAVRALQLVLGSSGAWVLPPREHDVGGA